MEFLRSPRVVGDVAECDVWNRNFNEKADMDFKLGRRRDSFMEQLLAANPPKEDAHEGEWGSLEEPCRFCREMGVFFLRDEGNIGMAGDTTMRCDHCKRTWQADSSTA